MKYLLGFDIGSSSVKAALLHAETGETVASATSTKTELPMIALQPGWAEQDPEMWWQEAIKAMTREQRQRFLTTAARETPRYYPLFLPHGFGRNQMQLAPEFLGRIDRHDPVIHRRAQHRPQGRVHDSDGVARELQREFVGEHAFDAPFLKVLQPPGPERWQQVQS